MKMKGFLLFGVLMLSSCSENGATYMFYVVIRPERAEAFIEEMVSVAKENGLRAEVNKVRDDAGHVYNSMDGRAFGINLVTQNAILSGREDAKLCGHYSEAYPDPAQYLVFTQPGFVFGSKAEATALGKRVFSQLQKLGFDVRLNHAICGAAATDDR